LEEKHDLYIAKLTDKDLAKSLENCFKNGRAMLIEDVGETLDPSLGPVLSQNLVDQGGGRLALRMGNQDIDYDKDFKLYITTKMTNPHYLPEITINVTLVNFTVTILGLEE
jgi:dynein heavy chain